SPTSTRKRGGRSYSACWCPRFCTASDSPGSGCARAAASLQNNYGRCTELSGGRRRRREGDDQALELARVGVEAPDALGELVARHRVLVVQPAEGLLVQRDLVAARFLRELRRQAPLDRARRLRQSLQQIGRDRQEIAAGEGE